MVDCVLHGRFEFGHRLQPYNTNTPYKIFALIKDWLVILTERGTIGNKFGFHFTHKDLISVAKNFLNFKMMPQLLRQENYGLT